jgi:hypothetical protein
MRGFRPHLWNNYSGYQKYLACLCQSFLSIKKKSSSAIQEKKPEKQEMVNEQRINPVPHCVLGETYKKDHLQESPKQHPIPQETGERNA